MTVYGCFVWCHYPVARGSEKSLVAYRQLPEAWIVSGVYVRTLNGSYRRRSIDVFGIEQMTSILAHCTPRLLVAPVFSLFQVGVASKLIEDFATDHKLEAELETDAGVLITWLASHD